MYGCKKYVGSRLQNTKKLKRFRKIVCSPKCKNTIRELRYLTYKKDAKGNAIYDEFNIDPHTFQPCGMRLILIQWQISKNRRQIQRQDREGEGNAWI